MLNKQAKILTEKQQKGGVVTSSATESDFF